MRLLLIAALAFFGVAKLTNAQELEEAGARWRYPKRFPFSPKPHAHVKGVRATFTNAISGAEGTVTFTDSTDISVNIEITDYEKIDNVMNWPECSSGGLIWSIQEQWLDANANELFGDDCVDRVSNTRGIRGGFDAILGGRYDPSLACSHLSQYTNLSATGQLMCNELPVTNFALLEDVGYLNDNGFDLITADKARCFQPSATANGYECWPCLYQQYHLACEAGDLSGKYGYLNFHNSCSNGAAAQAGEAEETEQAAVADEAAAYPHCSGLPHVHFKTHDRFMTKPGVITGRALRLSCNDGTPEGIPLMCAKLLPFVDHGKHY